jgi:protease I
MAPSGFNLQYEGQNKLDSGYRNTDCSYHREALFMAENLQGKKVAILVAEGFEQVELERPRQALIDAGAETEVVSPVKGRVRGWDMTDWGDEVNVDVPLDSADPAKYDALLLPGGVMNPDKLRMIPAAVNFVKNFFEAGKPVASICHGPWMLVEADVVNDRKLTSWPSLQTDIRNAGGNWVDEQVVEDQGVVTSRKPDDIPAFNAKMVQLFERTGRQGEKKRVA